MRVLILRIGLLRCICYSMTRIRDLKAEDWKFQAHTLAQRSSASAGAGGIHIGSLLQPSCRS